MHKIINKKSIQKITAIIIIMIMCNFIMSTKVWAVDWMSLKDYNDMSIGGTDTKQDVSVNSIAVKNLAEKWKITPEQAVELLNNHLTDENMVGITTEMSDAGITYSITEIQLKPTEEEIKKFNN